MRELYKRYGKRMFDLIVSVPAVIILSPLLGLIALLVRLSSTGPILFIQERLGQHGRVFRLYKFRTMYTQPRVPNRELIGRDPEITFIGYWLRRFKLDELPQLINVIKGDMSLVGPRPALPSQLTEYDDHTRRRLEVRPGLTGLAQTHGNIYLSWPERWYYDVLYVKNLSLWLDLYIISRTLAMIVCGERRFYKPPFIEGGGHHEDRNIESSNSSSR